MIYLVTFITSVYYIPVSDWGLYTVHIVCRRTVNVEFLSNVGPSAGLLGTVSRTQLEWGLRNL